LNRYLQTAFQYFSEKLDEPFNYFETNYNPFTLPFSDMNDKTPLTERALICSHSFKICGLLIRKASAIVDKTLERKHLDMDDRLWGIERRFDSWCSECGISEEPYLDDLDLDKGITEEVGQALLMMHAHLAIIYGECNRISQEADVNQKSPESDTIGRTEEASDLIRAQLDILIGAQSSIWEAQVNKYNVGPVVRERARPSWEEERAKVKCQFCNEEYPRWLLEAHQQFGPCEEEYYREGGRLWEEMKRQGKGQ
jgi:hypothetical protein